MSRGPGKIERAVLATVTEQPVPSHNVHRYWLVDDLGPYVYPQWSASPAQRRALQRAIRKLWLQGLVDTGTQQGGREHHVVVFGSAEQPRSGQED